MKRTMDKRETQLKTPTPLVETALETDICRVTVRGSHIRDSVTRHFGLIRPIRW